MPQDYRPGDDRRFIRDVIPLFQDPRYIRVGERPLLVISRPQDVPDIRPAVGAWRKMQRRSAAPPYLCRPGLRCHGSARLPASTRPSSSLRTDSSCRTSRRRRRSRALVRRADLGLRVRREVGHCAPAARYPYYRGVMTGWDNTPRRRATATFSSTRTRPTTSAGSRPSWRRPRQARSPEERLVFINAWNEWAEGAYLEPDQQFGRQFLEATRRAVDGQ